MATDSSAENGANGPDGLLARGRVLGWKAASSWKPDGPDGRDQVVPAKVGLEFEDGARIEVRCASDAEASMIAAGAKGEIVDLPVVVSAFGGRVKYRTRNASGGDGGWQ